MSDSKFNSSQKPWECPGIFKQLAISNRLPANQPQSFDRAFSPPRNNIIFSDGLILLALLLSYVVQ